MKPSALLVGLAAGLAAALLYAGLVTQSPSALGLSLAAPIPILLASLGWGSVAGFLAAFVSAAAISVFSGTFFGGLTLLASMSLGAAILGHLAGLARPVEETGRVAPSLRPAPEAQPPSLEWYPLPRILFAIAAISAAGCILLGWLVGFSVDEMGPAVTQALLAQGGADLDPATRQQVEDLAGLVVRLIPFVQPAFLALNFVATLYLSASITRASGRLQRPRDDIPSSTALPRAALAVLAIALAGSFLGGTAGAAAAAVAGAFAAAFTLVGLAGFHARTRGRPGRGLLIFTVYVAIILLSFPLLAFLIFGIVETARNQKSI